MAQDGSALFQPLAAEGFSLPGGDPAFEALTASGEGFASSLATAQFPGFASMTASATGAAGSVASGDATFEEASASGATPMYTDAAFEAMSAAAVGLTGTVASAAVTMAQMDASLASVGGGIASGSAQFQQAVGASLGAGPATATGEGAFRRATVRAASLVGSVATSAPSFEEATAAAVGVAPTVATGDASFERALPYAFASPVTAETFRTFVMNASNNALTEYQAHNFNSYAEFGGYHFAAGPDGIRRLDGTDDAGTAIAWSFRTGFMDGKVPVLKRLEEVLLAVRYDGPMRLRVWTDEDTYFDYNVPNHRADVVHQVRAKLGKGAKSRFFRVELSAMGTTSAEISSMQLPMIPLQRRLG